MLATRRPGAHFSALALKVLGELGVDTVVIIPSLEPTGVGLSIAWAALTVGVCSLSKPGVAYRSLVLWQRGQ